MAKVKRISHDERMLQRKEIAEFVKAHGGDAHAAVKKFNVSIFKVKQACLENRVTIKGKVYLEPEERRRRLARNLPVNPKTTNIIAELIKGERTQAEIAEKYKVTRQYVSAVKKNIEGVLGGAK